MNIWLNHIEAASRWMEMWWYLRKSEGKMEGKRLKKTGRMAIRGRTSRWAAEGQQNNLDFPHVHLIGCSAGGSEVMQNKERLCLRMEVGGDTVLLALHTPPRRRPRCALCWRPPRPLRHIAFTVCNEICNINHYYLSCDLDVDIEIEEQNFIIV